MIRWSNRTRRKAKTNAISCCKLMLQEGYITQKQYTEAVNTPLKDTLKAQDVNVTGCQDTGRLRVLLRLCGASIQNSEEFGKTVPRTGIRLLKEGGLKIVTTLDIDANTLLNETARNTIPPEDSCGMEIVMAPSNRVPAKC